MNEFRTLSGRTDAQGADSRARRICRAGRERKDHPVVRLLRPANRPAPWPSRLVHRVDRALTVLETLAELSGLPSPWRPGRIPGYLRSAAVGLEALTQATIINMVK